MNRFPLAGEPIYKGHIGSISGLAFSPDGSLLASAGDNDMTIRLWRVSTSELLHVIRVGEFGNRRCVDQVEFSPDGATLFSVVSDYPGTVLFAHDVASGELRWKLSAKWATVAKLSPDGRFAACFQYGRWKLRPGDPVCPCQNDECEPPEDPSIYDGRIRLLDLDSQQFAKTRFPNVCFPEAFSVDGMFLRTEDHFAGPGVAGVYDVSTGRRVLDTDPGDYGCFIEIDGEQCFAVRRGQPDGQVLPDLEVIKLPSATFAGYLPVGWSCDSPSENKAIMIPGTSQFAYVHQHRSVEVMNLESTKEPRRTILDKTFTTQMRAARDGNRLAIGDDSGTIRIFNTADWSLERTFAGAEELGTVAFSPDSRFLTVLHGNERRGSVRVSVWNVSSLEFLGSMVHDSAPRKWRFSTSDAVVLLFDQGLCSLVEEGSEAHSLVTQASKIEPYSAGRSTRFCNRCVDVTKSNAATSHNGKWMLGLDEGRISIIEVGSAKVTHEMTAPIGECLRLTGLATISEDGKRAAILATLLDGFFRQDLLFVFKNGRFFEKRGFCGVEPGSFAISPDGGMLAIGDDYDPSITLRNLREKKRCKHLEGHAQGLRSLDFSPDGALLASSSADGQVILWDAKTFERKATLMAFSSPDGSAATERWIAFTPMGEFNSSPGVEELFTVSSG